MRCYISYLIVSPHPHRLSTDGAIGYRSCSMETQDLLASTVVLGWQFALLLVASIANIKNILKIQDSFVFITKITRTSFLLRTPTLVIQHKKYSLLHEVCICSGREHRPVAPVSRPAEGTGAAEGDDLTR